jgi:signal peptidase II
MSKKVFVVSVAFGVVVLDQISKWYIRETVDLHQSIPVIDSLFNIVHVRNPGGAFNLLANASEAIRLPFFVVATVVAVAALIYFIRQIPVSQPWLLFAVAGVLGGAVGNFIDRILYGEVIDFLDVYWGAYHWPAFNVADSFISVGVVVLLLYSLLIGDPVAGEGEDAASS